MTALAAYKFMYMHLVTSVTVIQAEGCVTVHVLTIIIIDSGVTIVAVLNVWEKGDLGGG